MERLSGPCVLNTLCILTWTDVTIWRHFLIVLYLYILRYHVYSQSWCRNIESTLGAFISYELVFIISASTYVELRKDKSRCDITVDPSLLSLLIVWYFYPGLLGPLLKCQHSQGWRDGLAGEVEEARVLPITLAGVITLSLTLGDPMLPSGLCRHCSHVPHPHTRGCRGWIKRKL